MSIEFITSIRVRRPIANSENLHAVVRDSMLVPTYGSLEAGGNWNVTECIYFSPGK
jgi:hypothetical protein